MECECGARLVDGNGLECTECEERRTLLAVREPIASRLEHVMLDEAYSLGEECGWTLREWSGDDAREWRDDEIITACREYVRALREQAAALEAAMPEAWRES